MFVIARQLLHQHQQAVKQVNLCLSSILSCMPFAPEIVPEPVSKTHDDVRNDTAVILKTFKHKKQQRAPPSSTEEESIQGTKSTSKVVRHDGEVAAAPVPTAKITAAMFRSAIDKDLLGKLHTDPLFSTSSDDALAKEIGKACISDMAVETTMAEESPFIETFSNEPVNEESLYSLSENGEIVPDAAAIKVEWGRRAQVLKFAEALLYFIPTVRSPTMIQVCMDKKLVVVNCRQGDDERKFSWDVSCLPPIVEDVEKQLSVNFND